MINVPINVKDPELGAVFANLANNGAGVMHTSVMPTVKTCPEGTMVIYDDGAGTKRLYLKTAKKNLGYITLT